MANWKDSIVKSSFSATSATNNMLNERNGMFESSNYTFDSIFKIAEYSVVGINANKVENMREQIRIYVSNIEKYLNQIDPLEGANGAFKGEDVQMAVRQYIEKIAEYCTNLTTQLLAFSDKLVDVKNAWANRSQQMSEQVNLSKNAFSEGQKYSETIN